MEKIKSIVALNSNNNVFTKLIILFILFKTQYFGIKLISY